MPVQETEALDRHISGGKNRNPKVAPMVATEDVEAMLS